MKKHNYVAIGSVLIRLLLGLTFIVAGSSKLGGVPTFATQIHAYRLTSLDGSMLAAFALPWVEVIVGVSLCCGLVLSAAYLSAGLLLAMFSLAVVSATARGLDISCGCFGSSDSTIGIGTYLRLVALWALVVVGYHFASRTKSKDDVANVDGAGVAVVHSGKPSGATGFTLIELLVVISIIALLLAILLPVLSKARAKSKQTACAAQMRQIGIAFTQYANDNHGYVPRNAVPPIADARWVPWFEVLSQTMEAPSGELSPTFECPSHERLPEELVSYVVNAFQFVTQPNWEESGPIRVSRIKNSSGALWMLEASSNIVTPADYILPEEFLPARYDLWNPSHLPGDPEERVNDIRHVDRANTLRPDGSVISMKAGELRLDMFDIGPVRSRTW